MLSRRTLMKYTGLAWLGALLAAVFPESPDLSAGAALGRNRDGGSEQLPTNIEGPNPWDTRQRPTLVEDDDINPPWHPTTRLDSWMPKDGQTVLLATNGGGPCIWVATFYAATETVLHGKPLFSDWQFITHENNNQLHLGDIGDKYCWMPLPASPYHDGWDLDDDRGLTMARDQKIVDEFIAKKEVLLSGRK